MLAGIRRGLALRTARRRPGSPGLRCRLGGRSHRWDVGICRRLTGVGYLGRTGGGRGCGRWRVPQFSEPGTFSGFSQSRSYVQRKAACTSQRTSLHGASVLASRREFLRGDWARFLGREFNVRPLGSVAYKLALISAGLADATWTLSPKNEWDIAAGVALVNAAGPFYE